jgi:VIT1/CCC1 family predicted Fe2+/Mn2+ transporter
MPRTLLDRSWTRDPWARLARTCERARRRHWFSNALKSQQPRVGWLRAAVLGANDGIISTSSLILGAAAAATAKSDILLASVAGTKDRFVTTP